MKKVSIVLPVYNGEKYISESIKSVLGQSYNNLELIIVNDCSTDNSKEICEEYQKKDNRIRIITNEKNLKLPLSLNVGFSKANGDYYTWTSDDNIYKPNAINRMVEYLNDNPKTQMVYTDCSVIDEEGIIVGDWSTSEPQMIVTGNSCGACFLYRAEVAKSVGNYDPEMFLAEDYDYWIRIASKGSIDYLKENLYLYRCHGNSLTEKKKSLIKEQTLKVMEKNFLFLYCYAKQNKMTNSLFDFMMKLCSEDNRKGMLCRLETINKKYVYYLEKEKIKIKIKSIRDNIRKR